MQGFGLIPRRRSIVGAVVVVVCLLAASRQARADVNHQPIAVPLIGSSGVGSPYPSTLQVTARTGTSATGLVRIMLHKVTHPCPEELAVLLVRNNTEKYLLMSHAGGCKPLQGTDVIFRPSAALPDNPVDTTPHGPTIVIGASNYGAQPAFPAPAPAGPYLTTLPNTTISGTWDLYVIDTGGSDRGVIAAGWSLHYGTFKLVDGGALPTPLPAAGSPNDTGVAGVYPITFDFSTIPVGVKAREIKLNVHLTHTFPDDIRLLLESPNGRTTGRSSPARTSRRRMGRSPRFPRPRPDCRTASR
jgi:hypothetical protein